MSAFHFYLWVLYCLSATGLFYLWWRTVRSLEKRFLRDLLLGFMIVLLFTPWFAQPAQPELAPAVIILLHECLFDGADNSWRAAGPLVWGYLLFIILLAASYWIVRRMGLNSIAPHEAVSEDEEHTLTP